MDEEMMNDLEAAEGLEDAAFRGVFPVEGYYGPGPAMLLQALYRAKYGDPED